MELRAVLIVNLGAQINEGDIHFLVQYLMRNNRVQCDLLNESSSNFVDTQKS